MRGRTRHSRLEHFFGDMADIKRIEASCEYRKASAREKARACKDILEELGLEHYRTETKRGKDEYGIRFC